MTQFSIAQRLDLEAWRDFLSHVHSDFCSEVPTVRAFLAELQSAPESAWEANSQEWSLRDARWLKRAAAAYGKTVSPSGLGAVAMASTGLLHSVQVTLHDASTPLHRKFEPWLAERAPALSPIQMFISCAKALKLLMLGLSELAVAVFRLPASYSASELRELCAVATQAARFYRRNPGAAEFFPFLEASQRLDAQSWEVLRSSEEELTTLADAVSKLHFDSAPSMKKRSELNDLLGSVVQRARSEA
jgi:hypothetical protein